MCGVQNQSHMKVAKDHARRSPQEIPCQQPLLTSLFLDEEEGV